MSSHSNAARESGPSNPAVEMPRPTSAPIILSAGLLFLAAGAVLNIAFAVAGLVLFIVGLSLWISQLLPGKGHTHESLEDAPQPVLIARPGTVEQLRPGMAGYRIRMPTETHSISSGIVGGIVGGFVMPFAPLAYSLSTGRGLWYPLNLLAGTLMPGVDQMTPQQLEQYSLLLAVVGVVIHASMSLVLGLIYGVLLPTLPEIKKPIAWAALIMPVLWTGLTYPILDNVNPLLAKGVDWPSFLASQFVFGIVVAAVFLWLHRLPGPVRGLLGGAIGCLLMPIPAMLWGLLTQRGIWYPANLLAAMIRPEMAKLVQEDLFAFRQEWIATAAGIHLAISLAFGLVFGLVVNRLPRIPGPLAWGGLLLPVLWTATSYGLMGIVNPLLAQRVDWPWFIASQFLFGVAAAIVVLRSARIPTPPAGSGPDEQRNPTTTTQARPL